MVILIFFCLKWLHSRTTMHYRLSPKGIWKLRIWQNEYLCSHCELFQIRNIWEPGRHWLADPECCSMIGWISRTQFWAWRAAAIIFLFSRFFSRTPDFSLWKISILWDQPFQFFGQKRQKNHIFHVENICSKILAIFHLFQKESPVFVWNWAQNECLLLNIFFFLISIA